MEDVQGSADTRGIAIDEVGIKDLQHPIKVAGAADFEARTAMSKRPKWKILVTAGSVSSAERLGAP